MGAEHAGVTCRLSRCDMGAECAGVTCAGCPGVTWVQNVQV